MWDDIPNDIKSQYDFPVFAYTQKIYFGNSTVIFIHKVPKRYRLYEGEIPPLKHNGGGAGGGGGNNVIGDDIVMNDVNDVVVNDVDVNDVDVNDVDANDVDATMTTTISPTSPIAPTPPDDGAGEIDKLELIPISSIYDSLNTGWNGDKWRRCTIWSFKKLRPIIELYARIDI
jgi:hypothetical protein